MSEYVKRSSLQKCTHKELADEFEAFGGDHYPVTAPFRAAYDEWNKQYKEYLERTRPELEAREAEARRVKEAEAQEKLAKAKAEQSRANQEKKAANNAARGGMTKAEFSNAKKQRRVEK